MKTYQVKTMRTDGECYYFVTAKSSTKAMRIVIEGERNVTSIISIY